MTPLPKLSVIKVNFDAVVDYDGRLVILVDENGKLEALGGQINKLMKGALDRVLASGDFQSLALGKVLSLPYPVGLKAQGLTIVKLNQSSGVEEASACGVETVPL